MSTHNITIPSGTSRRLLTAGKYCDRDIIVTAMDDGSGGGSSLNTCTVILDIQTFMAFTPNEVRVFFTAYGDGLSAEFREVNPDDQPEIRLYNVVCGSAICVQTETPGASDATGVRYTDEYTHYIIAPSTAGATELITFTETT